MADPNWEPGKSVNDNTSHNDTENIFEVEDEV